MTVAPPVPPRPETAFSASMPGPVNMRFHPIAVNPNQPLPPDAAMHNHHFRPFPMHDHGPPGPVPPTAGAGAGAGAGPLDHVEARLKQLEQEDAARMAARSHLLAMRKHEDEEFRRVTENAEVEEEDLRRQRKRLKRESMGLGFNTAGMDSPPLRPTPARRLSETNAATTLAFFKQQSPHDARPPPPPAAPAPGPAPVHIPTPAPTQFQPQHHHHPTPQAHDPGTGSIRRKQKYTIKNVEAWGERHGRPASHDSAGRALWKRPSDGRLVYLTCPVRGCGKADFVTLHGFMCHLTKKHKDRSLGSQSRALELCGVVFDPSAPLQLPTPGLEMPAQGVKRASTEESRLENAEADGYGFQQEELEYESGEEDEEIMEDAPGGGGGGGGESAVKMETADEPAGTANSSTKQSISSIIDTPGEPRELPSSETRLPEHTDPAGSQSEKENSEPKEADSR